MSKKNDMTLGEIKEKLGISQLDLNKSTDAQGAVTEWYRHWDNENRVAVSIHQELVSELQSDGNISSLALQKETRTASDAADKNNADYTAYRIVKYTPAEVTL